MGEEFQYSISAHELKIYYVRAMDGIDSSEIKRDERKLGSALRKKELSIVNPYTNSDDKLERIDQLIENNLSLLTDSHMVLADLSMRNYIYVGAVFEIVQATDIGHPIVVCVGDSDLGERCYLYYYTNFLCRTIDEAIEYIWRCWTIEGINQQLEEEKEFYDKVALEHGKLTGKPYDKKESDIVKYNEEKNQLKQRLGDYCHDKKVLELGCGNGEWTEVIADVAQAITCIDTSQNMIWQAKEKLKNSTTEKYFIHGDFLDGTIPLGTYDIIVFYFTLSFLPPVVQQELLSIMKNHISGEGYFLFAESVQMSTLRSKGLGCRRIQMRQAYGKEYMIYKESFSPCRLDTNAFKVVDSLDDVRWFTFCAAHL